MRLLKYPLDLKDQSVKALVAIGSHLIIVSNVGHVHVWSQQSLVNTAFNKIPIRDLRESHSFQIDSFNPKLDRNVFAVEGTNDLLILATENRILISRNWLIRDKNKKFECVFQCHMGSDNVITDMKIDQLNKIVLVSMVSPDQILLFNLETLKLINVIDQEFKPSLNRRPITLIIDPCGTRFTVLCSDRSMLVYQINESGNFKLLNTFPQYVQVHPLHYKITMPPQGDTLPLINSIKGSTSKDITTTVLLDANDNYKIKSTIVSPSSSNTKVLKYSPTIYEKTNQKKGTKVSYNLLATSGTEDGTILMWNTKRMKPLFNAMSTSSMPINDIVWSQDGLTLFAISDDSVLYTFAFQDNDLGDQLSIEQVTLLRDQNKKLPILSNLNLDKKVLQSKLDACLNKSDEKTITKIQKEEGTKKPSSKRRTSLKQNLPAQSQDSMVKITQSTNMEFNPPSYNVPKDLKRKKPKVKESSTPLNGEQNPSPTKKLKRDLEPISFLDTGLLLPNVSFSRMRLATPKIRLQFTYTPFSDPNLYMTIKNGSGSEQTPSIVSLYQKPLQIRQKDTQPKLIFQDFIPKYVCQCIAGESFWCCCTSDGTLYTYTDSGRRLLPPMTLGVPITFLQACKQYLLCVTSLGELYCWDLSMKKLLFPMTTVYPLLKPSIRYSDDVLTRVENITMCTVTSKGVPLATLSNGDGYIFDKDMESWLLVSDGWWAYGSQYWDSLNNDYKNDSNTLEELKNAENKKSLINMMERKTNEELDRKGRIKHLQRFAKTLLMKEGFENMEEIVTLSHLENRILVSLKLEEFNEFKDLIIAYSSRLGELGYIERLNDMLQWIYNDGKMGKSDLLLGQSRELILKDILIACADMRHVQRVTKAYASAIGMLASSIP
ncbi:hypothetical protein NCAS_0G00690 [Naumovozyma castellii]|uniref:Protein HIR n=1 Tax=Naumovozyma castellii TaxID=27288 RepID=G0VHS2_NAUCA|nr:hypothetical protein NCAS_0G00690 [Naumovozyma castellii CBS 4309]CCC70956.1 hypothetical protein NCAS_0G00690 [Naumovozyma castellii CBS 4309]